MGVINLTPDSFSDGGDLNSRAKVLNQVNDFISNGVDIIDLGAQSTRPGAKEIGSRNITVNSIAPGFIKSSYYNNFKKNKKYSTNGR